MFKETIKDIGRKLSGEGPEVRFKNAVGQYEAAHRVSHEAAQKAIFLERINAVQHELTYTRVLTDETHRAFVAALNEVFGKDGVADMRRDAMDTTIYRALVMPPVSTTEFNEVANYFKGRFENKTPNAAVVRDCAENKKIIEALYGRITGDVAFAGSTDLEALIAAHPELGADFGKMLAAKDLFDMHERRFESGTRFNRSIEALKSTAKESLGTMVWKAPNEWWKVVGKSGQRLNLEFCAKATMETAKLMYAEGRAGTKLLVEAANTAKAYIDKKRA